MDFRIRSNVYDVDVQNKSEKYLAFLKEFNKKENKDLWSFFAVDFFHDGRIENLQFSGNMQRLSFRVSCPNIRQNSANNWSYIKPVWFECHFEGVVSFNMETQKIDDYNDPLSPSETNVLFLESEVNTLTEEIEKYKNLYDDTFLSIIIKTLPGQRNFFIVFRTVEVVPAEPLAFELMRQNKYFEVPMFIQE